MGRSGCGVSLRLAAADIAADFPGAAIFEVADLVAADRRDGIDRDEAGFAARRGDAQVRRRVRCQVRHDAHEMQAELFDRRRGGLRQAMHLDAGRYRVAPIRHVGIRRLEELVELLAVVGGFGRRTDRAVVLGRGRHGRILGIAGEDFPAGAFLVVEAERRRQIVDAGFAPVGGVAVLALPEKPLRDHQARHGGAILALGGFAELLAHGVEAFVGHLLGRRDRHRLVGRGRGRRLDTFLRRHRRRGHQRSGTNGYETNATHRIAPRIPAGKVSTRRWRRDPGSLRRMRRRGQKKRSRRAGSTARDRKKGITHDATNDRSGLWIAQACDALMTFECRGKAAKHWRAGANHSEGSMPVLSPYLLPIALLVGSNVFMTAAWYWHLRFKEVPLFSVILISWGLAFIEYCLAVPANRYGNAVYNAAQLKTMHA